MNEQGFNPNSLYYGDCLDWIREWEPNCIDLIYLDPPFNSSANYNVLFGAAGNGKAQVKGGSASIDGLRAFVGVVNNFKAAVGCFITIDPVASREARAFAAAQGTVEVCGQSYPRMNLWSVADYFDNRACPLPPMANPYTHGQAH